MAAKYTKDDKILPCYKIGCKMIKDINGGDKD